MRETWQVDGLLTTPHVAKIGAPPDLPAAIGEWLLFLSRGGFKE